MKKVLVITYSMIPHSPSWGGCQRMFYLAESLINHGYDVTVVSCDNSYFEDYGKTVSFKNLFFGIDNRIARKYLSQKGTDINKKPSHNNAKRSFMSVLKRLVKTNRQLLWIMSCIDRKLYNEPGVITGFLSTHWCSENYPKIKAYIADNEINNVIVSGPPFGMFRIIKMLKKDLNYLNIIMDYRDPWNLWKPGSKLTLKRELEAISNANSITCTNKYISEALSNEFGICSSKITIISNGFNSADWEDHKWQHKQSDDLFRIVYTGAISFGNSPYRDATELLKALCDLKRAGARFCATFVGVNVDGNNNNAFVKKLGNCIDLIDPVPNSEAVNYVQHSDLAVLLHTANDNSGKYLISGKLYDYIRCKIPVLSIGRNDSAHAQFIKDYSIGINVDNSEDQIFIALKSMYDIWESKQLCSVYDYHMIEDINVFSRDNQNRLIESLLK